MNSFVTAPALSVLHRLQGRSARTSAANGSTIDLHVDGVTVHPTPQSGWERFSLLLHGPADAPLGAGIHRIAPDGMDAFDLSLEPVAVIDGDPERRYYEAAFHRKPPTTSAGEPAFDADATDASSRRGFLSKAAAAVAGGGLLASLFGTGSATAAPSEPRGNAVSISDPTIAEVSLFAGNFAPRNWALCQGQLLAISQNTALFSLIGTIYGGDGRTTCALPDLRGRAVIGAGQGPGLSSRRQGQQGGTESTTLSTAQMPAHSHATALPVSSSSANSTTPNGNALAAQPASRGTVPVYTDGATDGTMPVTAGSTGGSQAHDNMPPFLAMNYIIALVGVYPSRS